MSLYFDWTVNVSDTDVSDFVLAGSTIDYGRPTVFSGFQAPRAVLKFPAGFEPPPPMPMSYTPVVAPFWESGLYGGAPVDISVTWDGYTQHRRFTGYITAIDWDGEYITVNCLGYSFDFEGMTYTYAPAFPGGDRAPELDLERVAWLSSETGYDVTVEGTQGRYVQSIPVGSPTRPLLDWLLELEASCDALFYEDRFGANYYRARVWDRPDRYTIPAGIIRRDNMDMVLEGGAVINHVTVTYRNGTESVTDENTVSTWTLAQRRATVDTILQYQVGAEGKARTYLTEHAEAWHAPDVTLVMGLATGLQVDDIMALYEGYPIRITPLPDNSPIATLDADIIGITDVIHPEDYRVILHLSPGIDAEPGLEFPLYDATDIEYDNPAAAYGE